MAADHLVVCRWHDVGENLLERLPFHVDIGSCIAHRNVQPRVTKPLTDSGNVNTGLEEVNGSRVPKRVGMDAFVCQSRSFLRGRLDVLSQQVANTEPSQRHTTSVQKDPLVSWIIGG